MISMFTLTGQEKEKFIFSKEIEEWKKKCMYFDEFQIMTLKFKKVPGLRICRPNLKLRLDWWYS